MAIRKEAIKVTDAMGFVHTVELQHYPHQGFTTANVDGRIIADVQLGRMREPMGDDDREWEMYEERLSEWMDAIKTNIIPMCREHFNTRL